MPTPAQGRKPGAPLTWGAFLAMAFGVIGLLGAFATYAAQIPLERAAARSAALTQALDPNANPDTLRPLLGDSATILDTPLADRSRAADTERARMLARFADEARDTGRNLRLVLAIFTLAGAGFGIAILGIASRQS